MNIHDFSYNFSNFFIKNFKITKVNEIEKLFIIFDCKEDGEFFFNLEIKNENEDKSIFLLKKQCKRRSKPNLSFSKQGILKHKSQNKSNIEIFGEKINENFLLSKENRIFFSIKSKEINEFLICPKISTNDSSVKAFIAGPGAYG